MLLYRRFAAALTGDCARLGADVVSYSFIVSDLHRLLVAGLPAHCERFWTLRKLIKIGAKVVSHGRYVVFQMAEVAIPRQMFQEILRLIAELRPQPPPAPA